MVVTKKETHKNAKTSKKNENSKNRDKDKNLETNLIYIIYIQYPIIF